MAPLYPKLVFIALVFGFGSDSIRLLLLRSWQSLFDIVNRNLGLGKSDSLPTHFFTKDSVCIFLQL